MLQRVLPAQFDGFIGPKKVGSADVAHLYRDTDIVIGQGFYLFEFIGDDHDVDRAIDQRQRVAQIIRRERRHLVPDRNHNVGTKFTGNVDRHVLGQPTIGKHLVADNHRREGTWRRHAGSHGNRQVAVVQHHGLGRDQVGRDGAKGNRQVIEVLGVARAADQ